MKIFLYVVSGLCWLQFALVAAQSKSAIHEIEYILFALVAIIAMSAGKIIALLEVMAPKLVTLDALAKKSFWENHKKWDKK